MAIAFGLRSGAGGPLTVEPPTVQHELLAPVDRGAALRGPALKQLRFLAFAGAVVGGIVGILATHQVPANPVLTTVCVAAAFALAVVAASATAMALSGRRVGIWAANGVACCSSRGRRWMRPWAPRHRRCRGSGRWPSGSCGSPRWRWWRWRWSPSSWSSACAASGARPSSRPAAERVSSPSCASP
ncbi:MAG: hypothetical protein R2726_03830 [Acidimicrobiales bacterium]